MSRAFSLFLFAAALIAPWSAKAAPSISLSASSIQSDANGTITHTITGIASGETVTVERFADLNNNGAIDFGEPSLRTFIVTDGVRPTIGGVVNGNVPGDDDGAANSSIRVDLPFPGIDVILGRQVGKYIIRVTGASGQATAPFEITAPNLPQKITGVLKNSSNNATISFGIIVILVGDGNPIGSVRTDSTGTFNIILPAGDYALVSFSDGFAAQIQFVSLPANQTVTQNLTLTPGAARVSGKVTDISSGAGLGGVFVIGQDKNAQPPIISGSMTDSNGNFGFNATAGSWEVSPQEEFASMLGYVVPDKGATITVAASPITQNLTATKANALIYGHITDASNKPIPGLAMKARANTTNARSQGRTTANGDYFLGVTDGSWDASTDGASLLGFREDTHTFSLSPATATRSNLNLTGFSAHVRGHVTDASGNPISNAFVDGHFENSNNTSSGATTQSDGSYDLPVWAGHWSLHLGNDFSGVDHTVNFTVVDGVDQTIDIVVPNPTGQISGVVKNNSGQGLAGIFINAQATIGGVDYQSSGQTDATGHFSLPVINGNWGVFLSCSDLQNQNYECPQTQFASINNNNATVNFTLQQFVTTASLNGRVVDQNGNGVAGIQVGANNQTTSAYRNSNTQPDGSFSIPVYAGQWNVQPSNFQSGLIAPSQQFTVTDGVNINNIQFKLLSATTSLSGTVKTSGGAPVSGIHVYANATINNQTYYLAFAMTDASGAFSFQVAPGTWNVNLDCNDLNSQNFNCNNSQNVDVGSAPGTANFTVTVQGAVTSPTISTPRLAQIGGGTQFQFNLDGNPGTYDIQGSPILPFGLSPAVVNTVTIGQGGSSVFVSFSPGANHFFRVVAR